MRSDNARFASFVAEGAPQAAAMGFGLQSPARAARPTATPSVAPQAPTAPEPQAPPEPAPEPVPPPPTVTGMRLAPVEPVQPPRPTLATAALGLLLAAITAAGALRQRRRALVPSH